MDGDDDTMEDDEDEDEVVERTRRSTKMSIFFPEHRQGSTKLSI